MQVTAESCIVLSINNLQKAIRITLNRDFPGADDQTIYEKTERELQKFSANDQFFSYKALKNHLGGYRWFFLCPKCGHQVTKLFLPPVGAKKREHTYQCKSCHRLKNQSSVMGQVYRNVTKPLKRMREIEDKLARGYIRKELVDGLLNEYETLEKELKDSPDYRLYAFKRKHNLMA